MDVNACYTDPQPVVVVVLGLINPSNGSDGDYPDVPSDSEPEDTLPMIRLLIFDVPASGAT